MRALTIISALATVCFTQLVEGQNSESGLLAVYPDKYHGRITASGVPYDVNNLSAAHATLPLGSFLRVANFDTGRMVDVKITDRKSRDGRLVTLSRAAAQHIGLQPNRTAPGSILPITGIALPTAQTQARPPARGIIPVSGAAGATGGAVAQQNSRSFKPFSGFRKDPMYDAVNNPNAAINQGMSNGTQMAQNRVQEKSGGLFKNGLFGKRAPKHADIQPIASASRYPAETMPLYSPTNGGAIPNPGGGAVVQPAAVPRAPSVGSQPASVYRVQFGAFRNHANARELYNVLGQSGIATSIIPSHSNGLNIVMLNGSFRTSQEANRWIDQEMARRGWRERPAVVR